MRYLKLFEEININGNDFPKNGHDISPREKKILTNLIGSHLYNFSIKVDDHYYYVGKGGSYIWISGSDNYNKFDNFNELKYYLLLNYHMFNNKSSEKYLELLKASDIDPSFDDNWSIWWASKHGYVDIVKYLLDDPRVDPSDQWNCSIIWASRNGHKDVVKLLLNDPRVDPSDESNSSIIDASRNGHKDVVKLLLNDPRVRDKLTEKEIKEYTDEIS